jgi:hypothetical protein
MAPPNAPPAFWTPTNQAKIIVTIVVSLDKLHSEGVPHGNVSLNSFLINGDFWACAHGFQADGMPGWSGYQASQPGKKTLSDDIFALGIVLYEVVTGTRAFQCHPYDARGRIDRGMMPSLLGIPSKCMNDVIENCWVKDPVKRWTTRTILNEFCRSLFEILPRADGKSVREVYETVRALPIAPQ